MRRSECPDSYTCRWCHREVLFGHNCPVLRLRLAEEESGGPGETERVLPLIDKKNEE